MPYELYPVGLLPIVLPDGLSNVFLVVSEGIMGAELKQELDKVNEELKSNEEAIATLEIFHYELEEKQNELMNKLVKVINPELRGVSIAHGTWYCEKSPTGFCYYDDSEDQMHDNCLCCNSPEERK